MSGGRKSWQAVTRSSSARRARVCRVASYDERCRWNDELNEEQREEGREPGRHVQAEKRIFVRVQQHTGGHPPEHNADKGQ